MMNSYYQILITSYFAVTTIKIHFQWKSGRIVQNWETPLGYFAWRTPIPPVETGGYLQCVPPERFIPQTTVRLQSLSKPPDKNAAAHLSIAFRA